MGTRVRGKGGRVEKGNRAGNGGVRGKGEWRGEKGNRDGDEEVNIERCMGTRGEGERREG